MLPYVAMIVLTLFVRKSCFKRISEKGDRVRVLFLNQAGHSHSLHLHGIHPAEMDGVRPVANGNATIYEFDAEPYGVHLYHCKFEVVSQKNWKNSPKIS